MSNIQLPEDKALARRLIDSQAKHQERKAEMGVLGNIFGYATEKPGNIAGLVIVLAFLSLVAVVGFGIIYPQVRTDILIPVLTGMITLALGYLFGKGDQR